MLAFANPIHPLETLLKAILTFFHAHGLTWAWSIVALTIVVRIVLVPLVVRQIHSMQSMQAHMPEMKRLKEKYKGDRAKMNEEMMKFYKENNINPAASCLPLLAQAPVFIALFYSLRHFDYGSDTNLGWLGIVHSITHHADAEWAGWFMLAIYAISQVASTYFMSATMDKTQRYLMMFLPVVFLPVVSHFPIGLVLYWMTTNLWTVGQGLITRRLAPKPEPPEKKTSRTPPRGGDGDGTKPQAATPKASPSQPRVVKRKKKNKARR